MTNSRNPSGIYSGYHHSDVPVRDTRPVRISRRQQADIPPGWAPVRHRRRRLACLPFLLLFLMACFCIGGYLFFPMRTNILLLGIDYAPHRSFLGRSDTNILVRVNSLEPYVGMLSIPRDLWVSIPGYGENRINTAHFFAEGAVSSSGPAKTIETIETNFGVRAEYYVRIRFDGVRDVVDAMGGVDIELPKPMAGYPAGEHHLSGRKALAFARNRTGSDDFFRMEQGQLLMKAMVKQLASPASYPRLPLAFNAFIKSVETNLPLWDIPRLGFVLLRVGPDGIDNRTITREMVTPYTTSQGANVLLPNWQAILPVVQDMFSR